MDGLRKIVDRFELEHVGSSLLNELAKGLYEPESVMREYIQNAIDAHRLWELETGTRPDHPIQVEYRGSGISILDYGIGMSLEEVRNVKSVAVSPKQNLDPDFRLTGHKGVGIWAGLSFFETLILRTTRHGHDKGYQITLNFKNILDAIDENTDIGNALNPNYEIHEFSEKALEHYTDITLINPTQSAEWFLDKNQVENAIMRICPCEIDPNFVFHDEIEDWYRRNHFEMFPIILDGVHVYRDYAGNVEAFTTETMTVNDIPVAEVWYAISKKKMMKSSKGELVGFRVVQNGFVIGGANPYSAKNLPGFDSLSIGQYPYWYVGEIHVTSPDLKPNLARNDFKESEIRRKFVQKMRKWYDERAVQGMVLGQKRNKLRKYDEYQQVIKNIVEKGAPVEVDDASRRSLKQIKKNLVEDEDTASQDKRGKSRKSAAPIDACRDKEVLQLRKNLLNDINRILGREELPVTANIIVSSEETVVVEEEEEKSAYKRKNEPNRPIRTGPTRAAASNPIYVARSIWAENDLEGEGDGSTGIDINVLLSLLEEVLREELPDEEELHSTIINTLRARIVEIDSDGHS